jgi:hypothetical protein
LFKILGVVLTGFFGFAIFKTIMYGVSSDIFIARGITSTQYFLGLGVGLIISILILIFSFRNN